MVDRARLPPLASGPRVRGCRPAASAGVQRWVDAAARCIWPGSSTGCRSCWPGSRCSAWWPGTWCRSTTGRCWSPRMCSAAGLTGRASRPGAGQGQRRGRKPTTGPVVTRIVDSSGAVSFAGTTTGPAGRGAASSCRSHRRRLGPAHQRGQGGAGASDPPRPGQGARRVRLPERPPPPAQAECRGPTGTHRSNGYRKLTYSRAGASDPPRRWRRPPAETSASDTTDRSLMKRGALIAATKRRTGRLRGRHLGVASAAPFFRVTQ